MPFDSEHIREALDELGDLKRGQTKGANRDGDSNPQADSTKPGEDDPRPPKYSDEALALRFTAAHGDNARYVALWGKWLLWTGGFWRIDDTLHAFDMARAICRAASAEAAGAAKSLKLAAAVASSKAVNATLSLARADRCHAATVDQWDSDLWSIGDDG